MSRAYTQRESASQDECYDASVDNLVSTGRHFVSGPEHLSQVTGNGGQASTMERWLGEAPCDDPWSPYAGIRGAVELRAELSIRTRRTRNEATELLASNNTLIRLESHLDDSLLGNEEKEPQVVDTKNGGIPTLESEDGQHKRPADRNHGKERQQARSSAAPYLQASASERRIRTPVSGQSRTSEYDSEDDSTPGNSRAGFASLHTKRLSCPFVKQDPPRYIWVTNSCTERFGFSNPARLVEHLKRVHSLSVPCCVICKQRFSGNKARAEQAQRIHASMDSCQERELTLEESEWMTPEQNARFETWNIQGRSSSSEDKWRFIYRQLFDVPAHCAIPDPYYDYLIPTHSFRPPSTSKDGNNQSSNLVSDDLGNSVTESASFSDYRDGTVPTQLLLGEMLREEVRRMSSRKASQEFGEANIQSQDHTTSMPNVSLSRDLPVMEFFDIDDSELITPSDQYQEHDSGYQSLSHTVELEDPTICQYIKPHQGYMEYNSTGLIDPKLLNSDC